MKHPRLFAFLAAFVLDIFVLSLALSSPHREGVSFLDVGQGDSELLYFGEGHTLLVDTGPNRTIASRLDSFVPSRRIDAVLITHPEKDHYGGLPFLLERYDIGILLWNGVEGYPASREWKEVLDLVDKKGIPRIILGAGDEIHSLSDRIRVVSPGQKAVSSGDTNDTGIVLNAKLADISYLLTADIDSKLEEELVREGENVSADILKVGHHGSKTSTGDAFLSAVSPQIAVVEVGAGNRYGHPANTVISRLESANVRIFRTDKDGSLTIIPRNGAVRIERENPQ